MSASPIVPAFILACSLCFFAGRFTATRDEQSLTGTRTHNAQDEAAHAAGTSMPIPPINRIRESTQTEEISRISPGDTAVEMQFGVLVLNMHALISIRWGSFDRNEPTPPSVGSNAGRIVSQDGQLVATAQHPLGLLHLKLPDEEDHDKRLFVQFQHRSFGKPLNYKRHTDIYRLLLKPRDVQNAAETANTRLQHAGAGDYRFLRADCATYALFFLQSLLEVAHFSPEQIEYELENVWPQITYVSTGSSGQSEIFSRRNEVVANSVNMSAQTAQLSSRLAGSRDIDR